MFIVSIQISNVFGDENHETHVGCNAMWPKRAGTKMHITESNQNSSQKKQVLKKRGKPF